jgi:site-specific recombinase XerD
VNRIPVSSFNDKKLKINVKTPRCLKLFLGTCKTKATKETYQIHLDAFLKHIGKDYESFLMLSDSELKEILEDYVFFCSSNDRYAVSTIRGKFASIEKFLVVNDRTMNKKKLMMFLPEQKKTTQRPYTTEEIRLLLLACSNARQRAIVHLFTATGCRPEGMADLKMKDIELLAHDFTSIIFYAGHFKEFQHFCHIEATDTMH